MLQYRIMVNNIYSPIYDYNPVDLWVKICQNRDKIEKALLERRLVSDCSIIPLLLDKSDIAIKFKNKVFLHWQELAKI
jgi:hypothetical protein